MKISEETKIVILKAAIEEISEVGISNVRTHNIAKRAGVAAGLLHYHFKTKENLILEIAALFSGSELIDDLIITPLGRNCSAVEKMQTVIYALLELPFSKNMGNCFEFYHQMFGEGNDFIRKFLEHYPYFAENYILYIINEGIEEKVFDIIHPEYFSFTIYPTIINNFSIHKIIHKTDMENSIFPDPYPETFKKYVTDSSMKILMAPEKLSRLKPLSEDLKNIVDMYIESIGRKTLMISPTMMLKVLSKIFNDNIENSADGITKKNASANGK
ncbi:MAG: helix-turn-helix transcriptional regulator [Spirochaetes bacterium]|nr:helix-turn-helix transcriptional regulator [Spirochaetota bacterium]